MEAALQTVESETGENVEADRHNLGTGLQNEAQGNDSEGANTAPGLPEVTVARSLKDTGNDEMYIHLAPMQDTSALFRFCHGIQKTGSADIAFLSNSTKGTAIKLALRNQTSFMDILKGMADVEDVREDPELAVGANWGLPTCNNLQIRHSARVTLRAI